jgi:4'-phosphopantetheinyl transferase
MAASAEGAWAPGPIRPLLADGAVHVWRADLDAVSDDLGATLSDDERARAERFLRERDGRLWGRSRAVLRALLGRYLRADPGRVGFAIGEHGKPTLADPGARVSFNLSHSGAMALYAFAAPGPVGVDVELPRRPFDAVAIAARELGAEAAERLQALPRPAREREFLRAWVRHEAELKCLGIGLAGAGERPDCPSPWIAELQVADGGAGAVVTPGRPAELRCWQWPARPSAPPG